MPPKRTHEDPQSLKEKLHSLQGAPNARGRRAGNASHANGSGLKEVVSSNGDNASTHSGQNEHTSGVSVSLLSVLLSMCSRTDLVSPCR